MASSLLRCVSERRAMTLSISRRSGNMMKNSWCCVSERGAKRLSSILRCPNRNRKRLSSILRCPNPNRNLIPNSGPMNSWILGLGKKSPWLMLGEGEGVYKFYSIAEKKVLSLNKRAELGDEELKLVGSSHGWVALFNERNKHVFLSNPISGRRIKLPAIDSLRDIDGTEYASWAEEDTSNVSKVIVSCSPNENKCRAVMSFGYGSKLAFCRPGHSRKWTMIGYNFYNDFVYSHKLLSCATMANLEDWDLHHHRIPGCIWKQMAGRLEFEWPHDCSFAFDDDYQGHQGLLNSCAITCAMEQYLVWGSEEQYLILRFVSPAMLGHPYNKTIGFEVYEIDTYKRKQGKLIAKDGSLDGLAMFVGLNHSFALPASRFPDLKPDSIYFTDSPNCPTPGHDVGIFDYKTRTFLNIDYPRNDDDQRIAPALWFTPTPH